MLSGDFWKSLAKKKNDKHLVIDMQQPWFDHCPFYTYIEISQHRPCTHTTVHHPLEIRIYVSKINEVLAEDSRYMNWVHCFCLRVKYKSTTSNSSDKSDF